jgi:arsenate reductase
VRAVKVLFVCVANSCRSQMAEAWARRLLPADWEIASGGLITHPIADETRLVMKEVGISLADHRSKSVDEFDLTSFDLVVSLSRTAARYLPQLGDSVRHLARPVPDPMAATGKPEDVLEAFRVARDRIRAIVEELAVGPSETSAE